MKLILVCGPFGSGSSAVAGLLAGLGLPGIEPYFLCNDERTPSTFESTEFREALLRMVSERTLSFISNVDRAAEIKRFRDKIAPLGHATIFLKHPLCAMLIPELCQAFDTRLVFVMRPLAHIEATRLRRNWWASLGKAGAQVIYSRMFDSLINHSFPIFIVRYPGLQADPVGYAGKLAQFAGLNVEPDRIKQAADFIRGPAPRAN